MPLVELNADPSERQTRLFAVAWLPAFCLAIAAWALIVHGATIVSVSLFVTAVVSVAIGLWRPRWMKFVMIGLSVVTFPIAWTIAHVLMLLVYFLVVTPIGLVMRAVAPDPLARRFDRGATTYWTRRQQREPADYLRQF